MRNGGCAWVVVLAGSMAVGPTPVAGEAEVGEVASLEGYWRGEIQLLGSPIRFSLRFTMDSDGAWEGVFDAPNRNLNSVPLQELTWVEGRVAFELAPVEGVTNSPRMEGRMNADRRRIAGTFYQGQGQVPFEVLRGEDPVSMVEGVMAGLNEEIGEQLDAWKVPGMAIAVVLQGEVAFTRGYGERDLAAGGPVGPETDFGLGPVSQVLTAFLVGALADEAEIDLDAPIQEYEPEFRLGSPETSREITLRDLLSHRSGLSPHSRFPLMNADLTSDELLARVAEMPVATTRGGERFFYNEWSYAIVGALVERQTAEDWPSLLRSRVTEPMGLTRTGVGLSGDELREIGDVARGHRQTDRETVPVEGARPAYLAPALGVTSSARDLARWALMLLEEGRHGSYVLSYPATIEDALRPHVLVPADAPEPRAFGLGWFLDSYRGHPRARHSGSDAGFTAEIVLLPLDSMAIVILANLGECPLPRLVADRILGRLSGLPSDPDAFRRALEAEEDRRRSMEERLELAAQFRVRGRPPSRTLEELAGVYSHPGYGSLDLAVEEEGLILRLPELRVPLDDWHFDVFRARNGTPFAGLLFNFLSDEFGNVSTVRVALDEAQRPIELVRHPEARLFDVEYLKELTGIYMLGDEVVRVQQFRDGKLRLSLPGQPLALLTPAVGVDSFTSPGDPATTFAFVHGFVQGGGLGVVELLIHRSEGIQRAPRLR